MATGPVKPMRLRTTRTGRAVVDPEMTTYKPVPATVTAVSRSVAMERSRLEGPIAMRARAITAATTSSTSVRA